MRGRDGELREAEVDVGEPGGWADGVVVAPAGGGDMAIRATGGDVTVVGSQLQAGRDADVLATGSIVMRSGENRTESSGSNKSRGGSVGVGLTAGQAGAGLTVSASGNQSKGRENGSSLTNTETTIAAGRDGGPGSLAFREAYRQAGTK